MDGNPWRWEVKKLAQHDNYDIATDFPTIREWEMKMSGAEHKLCFRHIRKSDSMENGKKNDNENDEQVHKAKNNNNNENELVSGKSLTSYLLTQFPNTTHNILIIEKIRETKKSLTYKLIQNDPYHKISNTYKVNKMSFRFLIDQLFKTKRFTLCLLRYYIRLLRKGRTVRDTSTCHPHIHKIKINDADYDLSQESIPKTPSNIKPKRSIDQTLKVNSKRTNRGQY